MSAVGLAMPGLTSIGIRESLRPGPPPPASLRRRCFASAGRSVLSAAVLSAGVSTPPSMLSRNFAANVPPPLETLNLRKWLFLMLLSFAMSVSSPSKLLLPTSKRPVGPSIAM